MSIAPARYEQDEHGEWWYMPPIPSRRVRAVEVTCPTCGEQRKVIATNAERSATCAVCRLAARTAKPGTRRTNMYGYVVVKLADDDPLRGEICQRNTWALEHRLAMRRQIGRPFKRGEIVHHINGDRADNRMENLQLLSRGEHPPGQMVRCPCCGYHGLIFVGAEGGGLV